LDHPEIPREATELRKRQVLEIAKKSGIAETSKIEYLEVSCATLENIDQVQSAVFNQALSHTYMGERVPKSYSLVEEHAAMLKEKNKQLPIISIDEFLQTFPDLELVKRALGLLTLWGDCIYYNNPPELASTVILDPKFLTKDVLAQLFNPNMVAFYKEGVIKHSDLVHVWAALKERSDFDQLAATLMTLMEKFEVCFCLTEDKDKPFTSQQSIIPPLLPETVPPALQPLWETKIGKEELEWFLVFNVVPKEMVSRLFVRLHKVLGEKLIWRHGIYFHNEQQQSLLNVELEKNRLHVVVRAATLSQCLTTLIHITEQSN